MDTTTASNGKQLWESSLFPSKMKLGLTASNKIPRVKPFIQELICIDLARGRGTVYIPHLYGIPYWNIYWRLNADNSVWIFNKLFLINNCTKTLEIQPIPESFSYTNISMLYDFSTSPYLYSWLSCFLPNGYIKQPKARNQMNSRSTCGLCRFCLKIIFYIHQILIQKGSMSACVCF